MALVAVCAVYNGAPVIGRMLRQIVDHVDAVHVYDGAFATFPHTGSASDDGTREIVLAAGPKVHWHDAPAECYTGQIPKRNATLGCLQDGDTLLIIDDDEWIANPEALRPLPDGVDVGWVWIHNELYDHPYRQPRLFRFLPGMHYAGRHYWIYDGQGRLMASHQHASSAHTQADVELHMWNLRREELEGKKLAMRNASNPLEFRHRTELDVYNAGETLIPHPDRGVEVRPPFEEISPRRSPIYSLIVPFSRTWAVQRWMDWFSRVELPAGTEILAVVDTDDAQCVAQVRQGLQRMAPRLSGARMYWTRQQKLGEFCSVKWRRDRIVAAWHLFLPEARGRVILGAEDDTLPQFDAYIRLLETMRETGAAFVQGTEVGRWSAPVVPHYRISHDDRGRICRIETATYEGQPLVEINGGGWYLFALDADAARTVPLRHSPEDPPMGPDVCFVYDLARRGYRCIGDWTVEAIHFTEAEDLHPSRTPLQRMYHERLRDGRWSHGFTAARASDHTSTLEDIRQMPAIPPPAQKYPTHTDSGEAVRVRARALRSFLDEHDVHQGEVFQVLVGRATEMERRGLVQILGPVQDVEPLVPEPVQIPVPVVARPPLPVDPPAPAVPMLVATPSPEPIAIPEPEPKPEPVAETVVPTPKPVEEPAKKAAPKASKATAKASKKPAKRSKP